MVWAALYRQLVGHEPPRSGISARRLIDAVAKVMRERGCVLLVCLDDIEFLMYENTLNMVVSSLLRLYQDFPGHPDCQDRALSGGA